MIHLSPGLRAMQAYPFEELDRAVAAVRDAGREVIDLGAGDPREETPAFIREALAAAIAPVSSYPRAAGLPELRMAIADWIGPRFGARVDPATEVLPTLGSKELVFSLAQDVLDPAAGKDLVLDDVAGVPGARARRPVGRRRGAPDAAPRGERVPPRPRCDRRRSSGSAPRSCGSTTRTTRPGRRRRSPSSRTPRRGAGPPGVVLASDEAYSELWFGEEPPAGALQVSDRTNVLVINTLSKRSSMTGYRSGFAAGDPALIAALKRLRPSTGVTPQEFVQTASVTAWRDEGHVEESRARYAAKRRVFLEVFARRGLHVAGERGDVLPVGARARRPSVAQRGRSSCWIAPASWWRPARSSGRRARAPSASRWSRPWWPANGPPRHSMMCCPRSRRDRHGRAPRARRTILGSVGCRSGGADRRGGGRGRDRAPRRGTAARGRAVADDGGWVVNGWAKQAVLLYFRVRGLADDRGRAVRVPRPSAAEARVRGAGRPGGAAGNRALRRASGARRRPDAELREHRRLGGLGDDGRHVGDRRIVRADRRGRAPGGRRRDRRGARAGAGRARRDRGRGVHRFALHRRRGRARRARAPCSAPAWSSRRTRR